MNIIEKLDSYQILTNLLPGTFFGLSLKYFCGLTFPTKNIGEDIVIYYFMGFIINRVGSIAVEPVLKKLSFIKYAEYSDFIKAAKADSKIDTLSEINNYIRSLLTCVLLLLIMRGLQTISSIWEWFSLNWEWCAIILLIVLFMLSYRKSTDYVCKRVRAVNNQSKKLNETKSDL